MGMGMVMRWLLLKNVIVTAGVVGDNRRPLKDRDLSHGDRRRLAQLLVAALGAQATQVMVVVVNC